MVSCHLGKQPLDLRHSFDTPYSRILPVLATDNHYLRDYRIAHFDLSNCQVGQHFQGHVISIFRRQGFGCVAQRSHLFGRLSNTHAP